jgi:hypothetical protein
MKEKRTLKRIKINLPVIYSYCGEHKVTFNRGTTYDISDSGLCFYTDIPFQKGLALDIQIPQILDAPRICIVKWNSMKSPTCFRVGGAFI